MLPIYLQNVMRNGTKIFNLLFATNDERHRWSLHPPHGSDAGIPCRFHPNSVCPRQIHADNPVRSRAGQCGIFQADIITVVPKVGKRISDTFLVKSVQQNPLHRFLVSDIFQHLIDEKLPLPIRIATVDNLVRFLD